MILSRRSRGDVFSVQYGMPVWCPGRMSAERTIEQSEYASLRKHLSKSFRFAIILSRRHKNNKLNYNEEEHYEEAASILRS